jgi:hypothetical protein
MNNDKWEGPFTISALKRLPASLNRPLYASLVNSPNSSARIIDVGRRYVRILTGKGVRPIEPQLLETIWR